MQGKIERKFLRKSRFFPQEPRSFVAKGVEIVKCTQINVVEEFQRMSFFLQSIGLLRRAPQKSEFLQKEYVAQKKSSNGIKWFYVAFLECF